MNKEKLNFFVTCPKCRNKFSISPDTVFKYVDRYLDEVAQHLDEQQEKVKAKEEA